jgi:hypothetical protein
MWDVGETRLALIQLLSGSSHISPPTSSYGTILPGHFPPKLMSRAAYISIPSHKFPAEVLVRGVLVVVEVRERQRDNGGAEDFGEEVARPAAA